MISRGERAPVLTDAADARRAAVAGPKNRMDGVGQADEWDDAEGASVCDPERHFSEDHFCEVRRFLQRDFCCFWRLPCDDPADSSP